MLITTKENLSYFLISKHVNFTYYIILNANFNLITNILIYVFLCSDYDKLTIILTYSFRFSKHNID